KNLESLDGIKTVPIDVLEEGSLKELGSNIGPVDVLFNGVGLVHVGTVLDCSDEEFQSSLQVNVLSLFKMIKAFLPSMIASGSGSIVNVASVQSSIRGFPDRFAYSTSKAAVIGLTKSV